MASHDPSAIDQLLHSIEGIGEIVGIDDCRHIVAHTVEGLCKGRAA